MTITVGSIHSDSAAGANAVWFEASLGANTKALIATVIIYDTSSTDGVVTDVVQEKEGAGEYRYFTKIKEYYDSVCDGHVSIWLLNDPEVSVLRIMRAYANGTCTDIGVSYLEVNVNLETDVVATENTTSTAPTITWTNDEADAILIECSLSDNKDDKFTIGSGQSQIYKFDFGSDFALASYKIVSASESQTMYWDDSDDDEDCVTVGASFKEISAGGPPKIKTINGITDWKTLSEIPKENVKSVQGLT